MKKIGILGGMSWESSMEYYRVMNETVKRKLGISHSANCLMYSFDFHEVETLQHKGEWDKLTQLMIHESQNLKKAGADFIVIATNTMHLMAPDIENATGLKVLHIAEAAARSILSKGIDTVLLLGTKFTMEGTFYRSVLENMGIKVMIPDEYDRTKVHNIIYNELIFGEFKPTSHKTYVDIIEKNALLGAQGVVLGCTEIPLLIKDKDVSINVFDTSTLHCEYAVEYALI